MAKLITAVGLLVATWVFLSDKEPFRSHFWLLMLCALLSAGLGGTFLGLIDRRRAGPMSPDERIATLQQLKKRYPATVAGFIILFIWLIFLKGQTFGSLQSKRWLIILCFGASVVLLWAVSAVTKRYWHNDRS